MKKLLLLGNNYHVDKLIELAKKRGVYTIVTDNLPAEKSPVKNMADEAWDVDVNDIDTLVEKAQACGVTAVTSGASEFCIKSAREMCKRMDLPFYISDYGWEITNDKLKFKELCEQCQVPVAKEFALDINFDRAKLDVIEYPVVVKPADGCSSIGLHHCSNEQELIEGYKDAYDKSDSKRVVVERYFGGNELSLLYVFDNGKVTLVESSDVIGRKDEGVPFLFGSTPTTFIDLVNEKLQPGLDNLFEKLECKHGVGSIQAVIEGQDIAVLEMNYRLPGAKVMTQEYICNKVLDYSLNEDVCAGFSLPQAQQVTGYGIWLNPGVINDIKGIDAIKEQLTLVGFQPMKQVGDAVEANSGMRMMYAIITFMAASDKIDDCIRIINENLIILDENGNDMVRKYFISEEGRVEKY